MNKKTTSKLKNLIKNRGFLFYLVTVLGVVESLLLVAFPLAIKNLVNKAEFFEGETEILISAGILLAVVILSFIVGVAYKILSSKYSLICEETLKKAVFKGFIEGKYCDISSKNSGDVISKLSLDANRVSSIYSNLPHSVVATVVHLALIILALYILEPTFTLIVVLCGIIAVVITFLVRKVLGRLYKRVRSEDSKLSSYVSEVYDNSLLIKSFKAEDFVYGKYSGGVNSYKKAKEKHVYLGAVTASVTGLMFTLFYALSLIIGANGIYENSILINFGVIIAVLQLITQIKSPVNRLSAYVTVYNEMLVSAERLFDIIFENSSKSVTLYESGFNGVEIENLSFSYDDKQLFDKVNLKIKKGEKVLIKGASGEGKSTLLKIISGVNFENSGSVAFDINGEKIAPQNLKGVVSYVPQSPMLFSGTVKENVAFNKNYELEDIYEALKLASVDFISYDESGINSIIGEKGLNLSVGQCQRISIARGLISNAPLVILDEATSGLDEKTESEILTKLSSKKDLTVIFVSHRPMFEKLASSVYELKNGKLFIATDKCEDKNA